MTELHCEACNYKPAPGEWIWTSHKTGQRVCASCLEKIEGHSPVGLVELNEWRKREAVRKLKSGAA